MSRSQTSAAVALATAFLAGGGTAQAAVLKDGDIIFHTSRSAQSVAVQRATGSRYSHMGMVLYRDGKPFVFEAVDTVRYTPLAQWTARGNGGHYVVKRLGDADAVLTPATLARLRTEAGAFEGRRYDLTFEWSDQRIYCSELVWKLYQRATGVRIGELARIRDFNLSDPAVRARMRERYGDQVPLDEPVISPVAMFDSPLLVTVERR
ncbi:YiiX family permuted papain-like enzyme [Variovorax robiniae]|uniref:YiiX family permuted papain-like enzyme n=1 Tax=Variovorax robiniae TaxID=1836199 RepID=A0ABU8XAM8_9BURK